MTLGVLGRTDTEATSRRSLRAVPAEGAESVPTPGEGTRAHSDPSLVSVVIPTIGRRSVVDAVRSVLDQTYAHVEVIVVYDARGEMALELPSDPRVRAVKTAGGVGAARARAQGIGLATGKYLALLDDDDTWAPSKLAAQLALFEQLGESASTAICATRIRVVDEQGRGGFVAPRRLIEPDTPPAEYLFSRRGIRWGEAVIHPSTILCERQLVADATWPDLKMHEDWEWLLGLASDRDAKVIMAPAPLVNVTASIGSASRSTNWRESLAWVTGSERLSGRHKANILLCTTAAYARAAGDRRAAVRIARYAAVVGPPGLPACLFFIAFQIFPPRVLNRLACALPSWRQFHAQ